jgi:hypothetical protein
MLGWTTTIENNNDDENFVDVEVSTAPATIPSTPSNASFSPRTLILSVLRQADPSDNWKIQAHFDHLKCSFKTVKAFHRPGVSSLNSVDIKYEV